LNIIIHYVFEHMNSEQNNIQSNNGIVPRNTLNPSTLKSMVTLDINNGNLDRNLKHEKSKSTFLDILKRHNSDSDESV